MFETLNSFLHDILLCLTEEVPGGVDGERRFRADDDIVTIEDFQKQRKEAEEQGWKDAEERQRKKRKKRKKKKPSEEAGDGAEKEAAMQCLFLGFKSGGGKGERDK